MRDHEFGDPARIACEAGRGSRDDVALQPQLLVLAAQAGEFVTFGGRQPVFLLFPADLLPIGLGDQLQIDCTAGSN
jgi:hypothetical protein